MAAIAPAPLLFIMVANPRKNTPRRTKMMHTYKTTEMIHLFLYYSEILPKVGETIIISDGQAWPEAVGRAWP